MPLLDLKVFVAVILCKVRKRLGMKCGRPSSDLQKQLIPERSEVLQQKYLCLCVTVHHQKTGIALPNFMRLEWGERKKRKKGKKPFDR
jgi:hypothetical protein